MGKKTEIVTKTAASQAVEQPVAKKTAVTTGTAPKLVKKKAATSRKTAAKTAKPVLSLDDLALRAYFISEKRQSEGLPGDAHQDWLEAERQLLAELKSKKDGKPSK